MPFPGVRKNGEADLLRIIFMGTPEFAVPSLEKLVEMGHNVVAVVTQPDKPVGRKQSRLQPPPVKVAALKHGIKTILQPEKIKNQEFYKTIRELKPDLIVTAAYGKILPKQVLDIPKYGCINVHASLLPRYRGAAPIHWAVINGEKKSGVTTMFMDEGLDTGDMLLKKEVDIPENMTSGELYDKLKIIGAEVLEETINRFLDGTLERTPQNETEATMVSVLTREIGLVDWKKSSADIHNLVRGTNPWPGAYTFYKGSRLKIWRTKLIKDENEITGLGEFSKATYGTGIVPGMIVKIPADCLVVATGDGFIKVLEIQPESKKRMPVRECGHNMDAGDILG